MPIFSSKVKGCISKFICGILFFNNNIDYEVKNVQETNWAGSIVKWSETIVIFWIFIQALLKIF